MPRRTHDMGGVPGGGAINRGDHQLSDWEILTDAMAQAVGAKKIRKVDESRRSTEDMDPELYLSLSYYERWAANLESMLIEKKVLTREEIDRKQAELEKKWGEP